MLRCFAILVSLVFCTNAENPRLIFLSNASDFKNAEVLQGVETVDLKVTPNASVVCLREMTSSNATMPDLLLKKNGTTVCSTSSDKCLHVLNEPHAANYTCQVGRISQSRFFVVFRDFSARDFELQSSLILDQFNNTSLSRIRMVPSIAQLSQLTGMTVSIANATWKHHKSSNRRLPAIVFTADERRALSQGQIDLPLNFLQTSSFGPMLDNSAFVLSVQIELLGSVYGTNERRRSNNKIDLNFLKFLQVGKPKLIQQQSNVVNNRTNNIKLVWQESRGMTLVRSESIFNRRYNINVTRHGLENCTVQRSFDIIVRRHLNPSEIYTDECGNLSLHFAHNFDRSEINVTISNTASCALYSIALRAAVVDTLTNITSPFSETVVVTQTSTGLADARQLFAARAYDVLKCAESNCHLVLLHTDLRECPSAEHLLISSETNAELKSYKLSAERSVVEVTIRNATKSSYQLAIQAALHSVAFNSFATFLIQPATLDQQSVLTVNWLEVRLLDTDSSNILVEYSWQTQRLSTNYTVLAGFVLCATQECNRKSFVHSTKLIANDSLEHSRVTFPLSAFGFHGNASQFRKLSQPAFALALTLLDGDKSVASSGLQWKSCAYRTSLSKTLAISDFAAVHNDLGVHVSWKDTGCRSNAIYTHEYRVAYCVVTDGGCHGNELVKTLRRQPDQLDYSTFLDVSAGPGDLIAVRLDGSLLSVVVQVPDPLLPVHVAIVAAVAMCVVILTAFLAMLLKYKNDRIGSIQKRNSVKNSPLQASALGTVTYQDGAYSLTMQYKNYGS